MEATGQVWKDGHCVGLTRLPPSWVNTKHIKSSGYLLRRPISAGCSLVYY